MPRNIDAQIQKQIEKVMKTKVVDKIVAAHKAIALTAFQYVTADSLQVGLQYGSPVLTGRYYTSHTIGINTIHKEVAPVNPEGEDKPYKGLPLSLAAAALQGLKLGDTVYIANSLPYAKRIENGWSRFKAPEGVYGVTSEVITAKFRNVREALGGLFKQ